MRAHYVPQFYLKNFGNEIHLYDKTTNEVRKSNPHNIALQNDFYGGSDVARQLESIMCVLEGDASAVIKKILHTMDYSKLSSREKSTFCSFVALQHLRTPAKSMKAVQHLHNLFGPLADLVGVTDFTARFAKETQKLAHLVPMSDVRHVAHMLARMGVAVGSNATDVPLWTSDNPVNLHSSLVRLPFWNLGFDSKGIEVHVPLSPTLAVVLFDPTPYQQKCMPDFVLYEVTYI